MKDFVDKTSDQSGTSINREAMMAVQGFQQLHTQFNDDGSITETNAEGHTLTTTFLESEIIERFVGEKVITKSTKLNSNTITEEILS